MKSFIFLSVFIYWIVGVILLVRHEKKQTGYVTPNDILTATYRSFGWGFEVIAYAIARYDELKASGFWTRKVL